MLSIHRQLEAVLEALDDAATVKRVYGEPVERGDRTVIPVAKVGYGLGGGFGADGAGEHDEEGGETDPDADGEEPGGGEDGGTGERSAGGEGGGIGAGLSVTPVGALEVTDDDTRFVRFGEDRKRLLSALVAGVLLGALLGRGKDD